LQVRAEVDYRKVDMLMEFTSSQGTILARQKRHYRAATYRKVARSIKCARQMALMPTVGIHPGFEDEGTATLRELFEHLDAIALRQQSR
jgi:ribosomal protein S18